MGIKVSYKSKTKQRLADVEAELAALRKAIQNHLMDLNMHGHKNFWEERHQ